jgi:hypothetical protein
MSLVKGVEERQIPSSKSEPGTKLLIMHLKGYSHEKICEIIVLNYSLGLN